MKRLLCSFTLLTSLLSPAYDGALAQAAEAPADLRELMREVCRDQVHMLQRQDTRLRYQLQRSDHKGSTLRDQIESHDGGVARLLQHDGRILTAEENDAERERLRTLLGSDRLRQREREEAKNRLYGVELLQAMPDAMQFTSATEQTPLADVSDRQIVIDFAPNPGFHPANMAQQILPSLRGRVWVDSVDHHLLRLELRNTSDVNLAWGLLAKVYTGGSVVYEQRRFQDLYAFTQIVMHLRIRELMLKTVAMNVETKAGDFQRLPTSPSSDEAVRMLLAEPVPTR